MGCPLKAFLGNLLLLPRQFHHPYLFAFRIPADMEPLYDLKAEIESGNYTINVTNANTPASLLKLWLRELASPLIPHQL